LAALIPSSALLVSGLSKPASLPSHQDPRSVRTRVESNRSYFSLRLMQRSQETTGDSRMRVTLPLLVNCNFYRCQIVKEHSLRGLCCQTRGNSNLAKPGCYPSSPSCRFEEFGNKAAKPTS